MTSAASPYGLTPVELAAGVMSGRPKISGATDAAALPETPETAGVWSGTFNALDGEATTGVVASTGAGTAGTGAAAGTTVGAGTGTGPGNGKGMGSGVLATSLGFTGIVRTTV